MLSTIKEEARILLVNALGEDVSPGEIQGSSIADLSASTSFRLASKLKKNPVSIAEEAAGKIASELEKSTYLCRVEASRGYINFYIDYPRLTGPIVGEIISRGASYGRGVKKDLRIILEHTSINPSGPIHIGRLRNSLIGDSLARILEFSGYDVETHYFVNDVGKQIAMIALGFGEDIEPDSEAMQNYSGYASKEDFEIFFRYVSANKRFEADEGFRERVQDLIKRAESGDTAALDRITGVAKKCLDGQKIIYDLLSISFDSFDFESRYIRNGDVEKVMRHLRGTDYARETGNGFGLDLSAFGLERRGGVSVLARTDGTSVYLSRDIAYHLEKCQLGDVLINVLGEDHKFEFRELSTILSELYGIKKPLEVVHFSFVSFEGMELSTRKGQTAPVDLLIDTAVEKAGCEIEKRGIASLDVAPAIAIGAIKYHILKTAPQKPITFRWSEALSFEGEAAPYIQYAHARCCSIMRKTDASCNDTVLSSPGVDYSPLEEKLVKVLMSFPETVERAALERKPSLLASYLYELASEYSRFYKECPVLSSEGETKKRRILLVDSCRQVLSNGLGLLGIEAPERM